MDTRETHGTLMLQLTFSFQGPSIEATLSGLPAGTVSVPPVPPVPTLTDLVSTINRRGEPTEEPTI